MKKSVDETTLRRCRKLLAENETERPTFSYYRDIKNASDENSDTRSQYEFYLRELESNPYLLVESHIISLGKKLGYTEQRIFKDMDIARAKAKPNGKKTERTALREMYLRAYEHAHGKPTLVQKRAILKNLRAMTNDQIRSKPIMLDWINYGQSELRKPNPTGRQTALHNDYQVASRELKRLLLAGDAKGYQKQLDAVMRAGLYYGYTKKKISDDIKHIAKQAKNPQSLQSLRSEYRARYGFGKNVSKQDVLRIVREYGINLNGDFHSLRFDDQQTLNDLARLYGYRKSSTASGSLAREFFAFLSRSTRNGVAKNAPIDTATGFKQYTGKKLNDLAKMFQGVANGDVRNVMLSDYAPTETFRLGHLVQMKIKRNGVTVPVNFSGESFLVADRRSNLWVAGKDARIKGVPNGLPRKGQLKLLGDLTQVDYVTAKQHIENGKLVRFWHPLGEVTKEYPKLFVDHNGFPIIQGGAYEIWNVGIVN